MDRLTTTAAGTLFGLHGEPAHERIVLATDAASGLQAIVAVYSTARSRTRSPTCRSAAARP
jgi:leucine dehydrogenase